MGWGACAVANKRSKTEKGESGMQATIKEAIDSERSSLDRISSYFRNQIALLEELEQLPDDDIRKIKMKREIQRKFIRVGLITKDNNLTDRYK
jgi:hypothetical protein